MPHQVKNFIGLDGFVWFQGIVENRNDPLKLGRCQVRCFGWHTDDKTLLPTADLPWALPMNPINAAHTTHAPREFDLVMGFFLDGESAQHPVMMGVITGMPEKVPPSNKGFSSPAYKNQPLKPVTRTIIAGGGYKGTDQDPNPYPRVDAPVNSQPIVLKESPEVSRLARHQQVQDSMIPGFLNDNIVTASSVNGTTWQEPGPGYNSQYPYNHADETESGHVLEFDDTKGNERVSIFHRTGTGIEMLASGTRHDKTVKDLYNIIHGNSMNWTGGKLELVVENVAKVHIKGATEIEIDNDATIEISGKLDLSVGKDFNIKTGGSINFDIGKSWTDIAKEVHYSKSGKDTNLVVGGNFNYDATKVYAQSGKSSGGSPAGVASDLTGASASLATVSTQVASVQAAVASGVPVSALSGSLGTIASSCSGVGATLSASAGSLTTLASSAAGAIGTVVNTATSVVGQAAALAGNIEHAAQSAVAGLLNTATSAVTGIALSLTNEIGSSINGILSGAIGDVTGELSSMASKLLGHQTSLGNLSGQLNSLVGSVVGQVAGLASPRALVQICENAIVPEINHLVGAPISSIINFDPSENPLEQIENNVLGAARSIVLGSALGQTALSVMSDIQKIGFTVTQAQALASQIMHFSNFNPGASIGTSFGLFQLSGNRLNGLVNFASQTGVDVAAISTQLAYMKIESTAGMAGSYGGDDMSSEYHAALALGDAPSMSVLFATTVQKTSPTQSMVDYAAHFTGLK